jgi:hypothetical protein
MRDQYLANLDAKAFIDAMKGIVVKSPLDGEVMLDITLPHHVEIKIAEGVVWVNVDGVCRLRICRILDSLTLESDVVPTINGE